MHGTSARGEAGRCRRARRLLAVPHPNLATSAEIVDLVDDLARNAELVCRRYLSNGRRQGGYWCVGDLRNTPGGGRCSSDSRRGGRGRRGEWKIPGRCAAEHGDLLDIIRETSGLRSFPEVVAEARRFLGQPEEATSRRMRTARPGRSPRRLPLTKECRPMIRAGRPPRWRPRAACSLPRGRSRARSRRPTCAGAASRMSPISICCASIRAASIASTRRATRRRTPRPQGTARPRMRGRQARGIASCRR